MFTLRPLSLNGCQTVYIHSVYVLQGIASPAVCMDIIRVLVVLGTAVQECAPCAVSATVVTLTWKLVLFPVLLLLYLCIG